MDKRKLVLLVNLVLAIALITATAVWAATTYFSASPQGSQTINPAPTATPTPSPSPTATPAPTVVGTANNFNLPPATVGVSGSSYVDTNTLTTPLTSPPNNPILSITTTGAATLYLHITCSNGATLAANYNQLQLVLYAHGGTTALGTLDILNGNTLSYQIPSAGTYTFDYLIHYTATNTGTVPIDLSVTVTDAP